MAGRRLKLPDDVVRHWPEVFRGIDVQSIPLEYLQHIEVNFNNGKQWIIETQSNATQDTFDEDIRALFEEYGSSITDVNFAIDSDKIKTDVKKSVGKALRKAKIRK